MKLLESKNFLIHLKVLLLKDMSSGDGRGRVAVYILSILIRNSLPVRLLLLPSSFS